MVIRDFDPPPGTYNVNGKLNSFIRSVVSRNAAAPADPTESFAAHWGLDAEALQSLRNLPEELQDTVMAEFSPPMGTLNVSGKLMAFIRTMASAAGKGGGPRPPLHQRGGPDPEGALREFKARWRLDSEALGLLESLPEDVRLGIIQDFQPRSDTWNPSGRLHAFVRARLKELELEGVSVATESLPPWRTSKLASERGRSNAPEGDDVDEFVTRWELDRSSEEMLRALPDDIRSRVLSSFEPQPNTRNRNARLATWVRSLQSQMGGGEQKRPRLV